MNVAIDTPTVLGDFELREQIGEGGFGTVYLAEQRALGRPAVVKVMRRSVANRRDANERFVLEARLASRLDHPCAAHIYAFGAEPDGTLWIAMELVKGTSLSALLDSAGPQPVERVVPMIERLAEAIQLAHEQGIVHRDIKPANVMVAPKSGRLMPKLLDFGIAKQLGAPIEVADVPAVRAKRGTYPPVPVSGLDQTVQSSSSEPTANTQILPTSAGSTSASLTQAGQILGSPPYMAPEQWVDPSLVGPATDQYALALLAFEALTGRPACDGKTLAALAEQAIDIPLPRSERISDAVHAVLARAAAKTPEERYPSVEQFAKALREATGYTADEGHAVPELRSELRTAWIEDAPQPIAEVIGLLGTARSAGRIIERVAITARVLARWLGVLAIACRSRLGRVDTHVVTEALRDLRRKAPRDEDWIDLAVALARPAADEPAMWPIPELATWSADAGAVAALRRLVIGDTSIIDGELGDRARASRDLVALEQALDGLAWLLDYEVGREVAGGVELWVGARSDDRIVRRGTSEGERVVLLDADGGRAVLLSPLVLIAPAIAGEDEEMFFFCGPSRTGAALFCAFPRGYERDEIAIWSWFAQHLFESSAGGEQGTNDERSPYPGLAAFTAEDRSSFVGRELEVTELVNRLRTQPIITVVGPSGAGKTSFLAAGAIPALPASWQSTLVRPGPDPVATLAAICDRVETTPYRDPQRADGDPAMPLSARLVAVAERSRDTFVLVIDQAEELFTQGADDSQRIAFAEAVTALSRSPNARVVIGVRDDFLCRLDELAAWRGVVTRHVQILGTPDRAALERIVVEPARQRGFELEDAALASRMVDEVVDRAGALPLLSFAAAELWERRDRHFKRITKAAYEQIGGVAGALVQHADGVVDTMTAADRRLVRLAFRRLLTTEGARIVHGRAELVAALGSGAAAEAIVERLLGARLIVSRDDDAGERVEIIHEALTRTWPRLEAWRQEDASGTKLHEQLVAAARHWHDRERPDGLLWHGDALVELRRWRRTEDRAVTPIEEAFVQASERAARRSRRRKVLAVGVALAALSCTVVVLAVTSGRISAQRADAVRRVAAGFEERGRLAVLDGDHAHALLYLSESGRLGATGSTHDILVERAADPIAALDRILIADPDHPIEHASWSDRMILTVAQGTTRVWDRASGKNLVTIEGAYMGAFAGDGVITLAADGTVIFTDATGKQRWRADRVHTFRQLLGIRTAGTTIATYGGTNVRLWDAAGTDRGEIRIEAGVEGVALDSAGTRLATVSRGDLQIWDVATRSLQATCKTPARRLLDPTFTPSGNEVVTGSMEGVVRVCNATTGAIAQTMVGHTGITHTVAIEPTQLIAATVSYDGTARVWNIATGETLGVVGGKHGLLRTVAFSPDGHSLATGADDGTIRIWDVESATPVASLDGHGGRIAKLRWDVSDMLESASGDGTVRRWNVTRATHQRIAHRHAAAILDLALSADGTRLLTSSDDNTSLVWDASTLEARAPNAERPARLAAFLNDHIVTADADGRIAIDNMPLAFPDHVVRLAASTDRIATASDAGVVRLLDAAGTVHSSSELGFTPDIFAFDPSGRWLFAVPVQKETNGVAVIDTQSGREVLRFAKGKQVSQLAVAAKRLAIGLDGEVLVYGMVDWQPRTRIVQQGFAVDIAIAPDDRVVITAEANATVWSPSGELLASLPGSSHGTGLDISRDGTLVAIGTSDGAIDLWDLSHYRWLITTRAHRMATWGVKFSADGSRLFTSGQDGRISSWTLPRQHRSASDLAHLIACRVPLRLDGEAVLPRAIDFNDPSCH